MICCFKGDQLIVGIESDSEAQRLAADRPNRMKDLFQIGIAPRRIDILTGIDGVSFDEARPNRVDSFIGNTPVAVIGRVDLIHNKKSTGRAKE